MMLKLLVATSNAGKLRDFALAADGEVNIAPMPGLDSIDAPEEDQQTFEGNARLKAVYYSPFAPGEVVFADDSGLEVDALGGAPGVRSARFAHDKEFLAGSGLPIDERNNRCLIAAMKQVPESGRQARYICVLAAARDGEVIAIANGVVKGSILREARGTGGFGYDPCFRPEEQARSMAELDPKVRLCLSHRGRALRDLLRNMAASGIHSTR